MAWASLAILDYETTCSTCNLTDCTLIVEMKRPITVLIPCKNEELNIADCIASCDSIADEILVADSGSVDHTLEIARLHPRVRIIEREYVSSGDFKNWAIPQALNDWIVLVDADERLTPELCAEIEMTLSRGPEFDGYWMYRLNHFMGHPLRFGDARTDKVIRLFRRTGCRYEGPSDHGEVHVDSGRVGYLKNKLVHFSFWSYDQLMAKHHRYTKFQAEQWFDAGRDTSYFRLLVRPVWRFLREYLFQGGILDGKKGLQLSWLAALYSFMKQARLWELNHALPQAPDDTAALSVESLPAEADSRNAA